MVAIVSYNVNGIRSALSKGFSEWLNSKAYDIVCIQETKAQPEDVQMADLETQGYQHFWASAQKKGYSGVAIFTKIAPLKVTIGSGMEQYDREGRFIRADFEHFSVLNCYFPSGTTSDERQQFKMQFLDDFFQWISELKESIPNLIVVGDFNIAHTELDIHDPKGNKNSSGFLPEEREWLTKWFNNGFSDAYRYLKPQEISYSWWSFRAGARGNNKGWRIDYQAVAQPLLEKVADVQQLTDVVHSDHCPVLLWLNA
ncbi:MAG: exodeoxyribonuclease III [Bacteroidetes bacterium]|nr:exodeoxyribonuclease III [Bacteroidota bacterium]